jgi:NAD(P)-dependent dehydrogenase (short-subunit alcohol dehydrogenase family)
MAKPAPRRARHPNSTIDPNFNQRIHFMKQVIVITGASSGFGRLSANALAKAGHTVYASMRDTTGRNAAQVADVQKYAKDNQVDLRGIELDVGSQKSADAAIAKIVAEQGRLDVVIHNAGHMVFGPAEAFTPEQLAELYDVNVLSTQRVNRAALPQLRKQGKGLLVWVSSSSSAGGTPPYLAPYFAAKAAMDAMAVVYARELTRWGIETSIIVPGAFTGGTNHFAHSGSPVDVARVAEYEAGPYKGFGAQITTRSPRSCRRRRMHRPWRMRSSGSSMRRSASGRSVFISTRPKTVPTSHSR